MKPQENPELPEILGIIEMTRKAKRLAEVEKQLIEEKEGSRTVLTNNGNPQKSTVQEPIEDHQDISFSIKKSSQNDKSHFPSASQSSSKAGVISRGSLFTQIYFSTPYQLDDMTFRLVHVCDGRGSQVEGGSQAEGGSPAEEEARSWGEYYKTKYQGFVEGYHILSWSDLQERGYRQKWLTIYNENTFLDDLPRSEEEARRRS